MNEFDDRSERTWTEAMADESPPLYPLLDGKLFWLLIARYPKPLARAA